MKLEAAIVYAVIALGAAIVTVRFDEILYWSYKHLW